MEIVQSPHPLSVGSLLPVTPSRERTRAHRRELRSSCGGETDASFSIKKSKFKSVLPFFKTKGRRCVVAVSVRYSLSSLVAGGATWFAPG